MIRFSNCSRVLTSVVATIENSRLADSMRPDGSSMFCRRKASSTSRGVSAIAGQPVAVDIDAHRRLALAEDPHVGRARQHRQSRLHIARSGNRETSSDVRVPAVTAIQMIGNESASTFAITGSSMLSGNRARTRATLSRTSAAAESGSRVMRKRTLIWLCFRAARRRQQLDAFDAGERVLEHLGDLRLDHIRRGAWIASC